MQNQPPITKTTITLLFLSRISHFVHEESLKKKIINSTTYEIYFKALINCIPDRLSNFYHQN